MYPHAPFFAGRNNFLYKKKSSSCYFNAYRAQVNEKSSLGVHKTKYHNTTGMALV